ncbi:MAG: hypothetical protein ACI8RD_014418, partial [Bacillariaceae sp.]
TVYQYPFSFFSLGYDKTLVVDVLCPFIIDVKIED